MYQERFRKCFNELIHHPEFENKAQQKNVRLRILESNDKDDCINLLSSYFCPKNASRSLLGFDKQDCIKEATEIVEHSLTTGTTFTMQDITNNNKIIGLAEGYDFKEHIIHNSNTATTKKTSININYNIRNMTALDMFELLCHKYEYDLQHDFEKCLQQSDKFGYGKCTYVGAGCIDSSYNNRGLWTLFGFTVIMAIGIKLGSNYLIGRNSAPNSIYQSNRIVDAYQTQLGKDASRRRLVWNYENDYNFKQYMLNRFKSQDIVQERIKQYGSILNGFWIDVTNYRQILDDMSVYDVWNMLVKNLRSGSFKRKKNIDEYVPITIKSKL